MKKRTESRFIMQNPFTVSQMRPIRDGMTVSRDAKLGEKNRVSWFSLGAGTDISRERYDSPSLYLCAEGRGVFLLGEDAHRVALSSGELLIVPGGTLCGVDSPDGVVYTEIITEKEITMNNQIHSGEALSLANLIDYEDDSITNMDIVHTDDMKFVLMAFDAGTGLTPHRAPGNAIVTALDGEAVIGYEGKDYLVHAGDSFRFDKNGLHSITANKRFKMSLLLVLE